MSPAEVDCENSSDSMQNKPEIEDEKATNILVEDGKTSVAVEDEKAPELETGDNQVHSISSAYSHSCL
jgi:hypothetical protein